MTASDYHIYLPADGFPVIVERDGVAETMEFPTLTDATRHLRRNATGFVVIYDRDLRSPNRIPLALAG